MNARRESTMKTCLSLTLAIAILASGLAPARAATLGGPLTLEDEGAFFVNGKTVTSNYPGASLITGPSAPGRITVNQMYVHYRIPVGKHGAPVVMVRGSNHTGMTYETTSAFARVPVLSLWGDNSVGAKQTVNGDARRNGCLAAVNAIKAAGGRATLTLLPEIGIKGNSHMMMMDRNNLQVAEVILKWLAENAAR
jgi:hypothetical protein